MSDNQIPKIIKNVPYEKPFSFIKNTTYSCGGNAEIAYYPETLKQASAVFTYLKDSGKKFAVLGNGSNILANDDCSSLSVISTKKLNKICKLSSNRIFCQAGVKVSALLKFCEKEGLGGLEYLAGIPATMGGLTYMNGGADGVYIEKNILSVLLFDGKMHRFSNKMLNFGYKYSTMRDINCLILGSELSIYPKSPIEVRASVQNYINKRKHLPKGASCGCVFKNPFGMSAGKIIDDAGLKGVKIGNAEVSPEHANFIINRGNKSSDVSALINLVKQRVYEISGIVLEEEVVYIGDD